MVHTITTDIKGYSHEKHTSLYCQFLNGYYIATQ